MADEVKEENRGPVANNVLQEQLWFTATTLGVNAFLMSGTVPPKHPCMARLVSTVISLYAAYLILERSAGAAGKIKLPEGEAAQKTYRDKWLETHDRLKVIPQHFLFVVGELSGSFFYFLLVFFSWVAVLIGS